MKRITTRLTAICLVTLMLAAIFAGCSSKSVDGYYICGKYALKIQGDTATMYYAVAGIQTIEASVEKTDEGADLYFGASSSVFLNEMNDYNPMHVKLSSDGEKMYLSADSSDWSADTYDVITEKEFNEFIEDARLPGSKEQIAGIADDGGKESETSDDDAKQGSEEPSEPMEEVWEEVELESMPVYDGTYYIATSNDVLNPGYTAISGKKTSKDTVEFMYRDSDGSEVKMTFGGGALGSDQSIGLSDDAVALIVEPGETRYATDPNGRYAMEVYNPTDSEQSLADCPVLYCKFSRVKQELYVDGQKIQGLNSTLDDLFSVMGDPTAAFGTGAMMKITGFCEGNGDIFYMWLYDDFFIVAETDIYLSGESVSDVSVWADILAFYCYNLSDEAADALEKLVEKGNNYITQDCFKVLTNLGLL